MAGIRLMRARQHLDERAFAGTVFAEQRQHLAGAQFQIRLPERLHAGKSLVDALHAQERCGLCRHGGLLNGSYEIKSIGQVSNPRCTAVGFDGTSSTNDFFYSGFGRLPKKQVPEC